MALLITALTLVYVVSAAALAIYTGGFAVLLLLWLRHRGDHVPLPAVPDDALPTVTVQLPLYNERAVIERLLDAVAALDYPRDRLHVQVLDDSTDDTSALAARCAAKHARAGLRIEHLRRGTQQDYKAGALRYGLERSDAVLVAMFDADFVPPPDFLRRAVPYFVADPQLGIVQGRWAHFNAGQNLITRSQAISIDGHFVIEQTARNRAGLLLSFNGTGGVWRRACIEDAGGWSFESLAEDLDLSYRAQLKGWRYLYLPDLAVPAELPPQIAAFKRQQARWAKGTTQNLLRLLPAVLGSTRLNLFQKFMAVLHLCQYLPHLLLLTLVVLTPPLMLAGVLEYLPLAPLGLVGIAPPLMYVLSQRALYRDWPRRLLALPLLLAVGSGVVLNNATAVIEAFLRRPNEFKRTPKFSGQDWQRSHYALRADWTTLAEALLALYVLAGGIVALRVSPGMAPFLFAQALGFGAMVAWGMAEGLQLRGKGKGEQGQPIRRNQSSA